MAKSKMGKILEDSKKDQQSLNLSKIFTNSTSHSTHSMIILEQRWRKRLIAKMKRKVLPLHLLFLGHRLASATAENEVLHAKYSAALQEADTANEHNKEHSALIKVHKLHDNQAPAHMEKLEEQFTTLRLRWIPCTT
ncbi:hypothetical protein OIU77_022918 [Salix suchowensis]|uniref:Uncharacterized protein n=1 Tax=Salix suchowensis TaxID=1278906 RepID=A0ABQ9C533_9ROSI|nr:hypothetical protein OIU77_022918 [Salix suchowensis]